MQAKGEYLGLLHSGVKIVDLNAGNIFSATFQLIKHLRKTQEDVILSTLIPTNIVAILARLLSRRKLKLYLREANTISRQIADRPFIKRFLLTKLVKACYPLADGHIGISATVAEDLQKFINIPKSKITTIYNPCDISEIEHLAKENVAHKWFADGTKPLIVAVGRLTHQKDFATLINAFALARQSVDARLIILGQGEEEQNLRKLIINLSMEHFIELLGFQKNPYAFIAKSSLFVLSSIYEGASNVIVEALVCRVPVICTDCPGANAEIINYGEFGTIVPVGNVEALAGEIINSLTKGHNKKEFIKSRADDFLLEKIAPQYLDALGMRRGA